MQTSQDNNNNYYQDEDEDADNNNNNNNYGPSDQSMPLATPASPGRGVLGIGPPAGPRAGPAPPRLV